MTWGKKKLKKREQFDPFVDRTARDIRNSLSESFVAALAVRDPAKYLIVARKWREQNLSALHADYIGDRLLRYQHVFNAFQAGGMNDPLQQAVIIWNQRLFFEFHDYLEPHWKAATGDQRQVLKGLIKAAGVYIHLEQHHRQAAKSLAMKSYQLLRKYAHCLAFIANHETLLDKLESGDPVPPRLKILTEKTNKTVRRGDAGAGKETAC
ncbi:MAG: DUF309 domain-containing protein [Desulfobacterales bacterium]|jgi:hypothetical protein